MMTYTFLVIAENPNKVPVGTIVDVELKPSEYDDFKEANKEYLKRYFETGLNFSFDANLRPDGRAMERLSRIRDTTPGAKNMFDNTRWIPKREF